MSELTNNNQEYGADQIQKETWNVHRKYICTRTASSGL